MSPVSSNAIYWISIDKRVQCFDLNGNFLQQSLANEVGPVYAVSFAASNASVLYAVNGYNSRATAQYDKKIYLISTKTGDLVGSINLAPDVRTPHDLALADDASEIYIANLNPPVVFKYSLVNYNCKIQYIKFIIILVDDGLIYLNSS